MKSPTPLSSSLRDRTASEPVSTPDGRYLFEQTVASLSSTEVKGSDVPRPPVLEERFELHGQLLTLRAIRPDDDAKHRNFMSQIAPRDMYLRFFTGARRRSELECSLISHSDLSDDEALVVVGPDAAAGDQILGIARVYPDSSKMSAEFAILVRSDLKGRGLGAVLMQRLIRCCRTRGLKRLWGDAMSENTRIVRLCRSFGFEVSRSHHGFRELVLHLI